MRIRLSDHFTYGKLLRFVAPSVAMMIFTSIYSVVDGFFISNFVGKTPFAAISLIYPVLGILSAAGTMLGTGGTAITGKTLGENNGKLAEQYFSMLIYALTVTGIILGSVGFLVMRPVAVFLKAQGSMLDDCVLYGRILALALPFQILQLAFQSFFVVAEKPRLGFSLTVISGVCNMILDAIFILGFSGGLAGAALATGLSQMLGTALSLAYFARENDSLLRLTTKTKFHGRIFIRACINGSSEMMTNLASSLVSILYNWQLIRFAGENGVSAFGVIMYISFIFSGIFYGYCTGSAPVASYQYGADNRDELRNIFHKSIVLMSFFGGLMVIFALIGAAPLSRIFVGYDPEVYDMTVHGFRVFSLTFLLTGISAFGSSFFTALNDGKTSALISFLRTFVFDTLGILVIPEFIPSIDGIWWAIVMSELAAFLTAVFFLVMKRKKYHYA